MLNRELIAIFSPSGFAVNVIGDVGLRNRVRSVRVRETGTK